MKCNGISCRQGRSECRCGCLEQRNSDESDSDSPYYMSDLACAVFIVATVFLWVAVIFGFVGYWSKS